MGVSRRSFLGLAAAGAVTAVGGTAVVAVRSDGTADAATPEPSVVPFYGLHQAGIVTPAQDRLQFAAFDVITKDRNELRDLMLAWTAAAARMTQGLDAGPIGAVAGPLDAPPDDTGEAQGLAPGRLTLTVGFGPGLFDKRFGLASRKPAALVALPAFAADALDPTRSGGDLAVQACSDDPQVAVHAIRNLARIGRGVVAVRWSQLGFGRTSSTSVAQETPRNMLGFKDGTANLKVEDAALLDQHVWAAQGDGAAWMTGGSYLVARRIRMRIETWDRSSLGEQQDVIGRTKGIGGPLSGGGEFDPVDFTAVGADGAPKIPTDAHVRLAHPSTNHDARLLRRGYNFVDGSDALGHLESGLFFLAYQRDPRKQFVPIQRRLAATDALNEYIQHVGSAIFACPPGVAAQGDFWGQALFA